MLSPPVFHVAPAFEPVLTRLGLDAAAVFRDPRVVAWRKLEDRENCTLDAGGARLHVKRYFPARGAATPAEAEVRGYELLEAVQIPTAPLAAWGVLPDGRSFTVWQDLTGYTPADKLVAAGAAFADLLPATTALAARLHGGGLHHRDLYLCHFMVPPEGSGDATGLRLIDTARVRRLGNFLTRRRWVVKDLAQFWYSTTKLPVTDAERDDWLARYAAARADGTTAATFRAAVGRKVRAIARHDRKLNAARPGRNISIPARPA